MRGLAALALVAALGCGPRPRPPEGPAAEPAAAAWRTLRAEHRVQLTVELDGGARETRSLRGAIAVERPDRFRLRALGPGGIALFDLLHVRGETQVLQAIRDPKSSVLGEIIPQLAGDLSAAYALEPAPPERRVQVAGDAVVVDEPARRVRLSGFRRVHGVPVPMRIEIANRARRYQVVIEAHDVEVDVALDPALFRP